jgi:hypothetical protein
VFPISAPSYVAVNHALVKELARRGHQVTVQSQIPQENATVNYTVIAIEKTGLAALVNMSYE